MATLEAHGIGVELPDGFEGRIFVRPTTGDEVTYPVAHFATFPLPYDVGDFGSGAVTEMGPSDIFAALFEYGPSSLGTRLFARQGMPRSLNSSNFKPTILRRGIGGQSGTQWFFTETGRAFTLYVVLGSHAMRGSLVPRVNELLRSVIVEPPTESLAGPSGRGPSAKPDARWN